MERSPGQEADHTLPVLIFNALAKQAGTAIVRQFFEQSEEDLNEGYRGSTIEDEEFASWGLNVDEDRMVVFHFHGWGPMSLDMETASTVLNTSDDIDQALKSDAD